MSTIDSIYHEERLIQEEHAGDNATICSLRVEKVKPIYYILRARIENDGAEMTCGYYSIVRTAQFNGLVPYEYLVYLFDSFPYKEDKSFDYTSYLPWADGIKDRVKEHIA